DRRLPIGTWGRSHCLDGAGRRLEPAVRLPVQVPTAPLPEVAANSHADEPAQDGERRAGAVRPVSDDVDVAPVRDDDDARGTEIPGRPGRGLANGLAEAAARPPRHEKDQRNDDPHRAFLTLEPRTHGVGTTT